MYRLSIYFGSEKYVSQICIIVIRNKRKINEWCIYYNGLNERFGLKFPTGYPTDTAEESNFRGPKRHFSGKTQANIDPETRETVVTNRPSYPNRWVGAQTIESNRWHEEDLRRTVRRARVAQPRPLPTLLCDARSQLFRSRLGLHRHRHHRHQKNGMEKREERTQLRCSDASGCRLLNKSKD